MILVDTSVWVDYLRKGDPRLGELLAQSAVVTHPFVIGELACGAISNRREVLDRLGELPSVPVATTAEVLEMIETRALGGRGIGYVDVHLLASIVLDPGCWLWTKDGALRRVATEMGVAVAGL